MDDGLAPAAIKAHCIEPEDAAEAICLLPTEQVRPIAAMTCHCQGRAKSGAVNLPLPPVASKYIDLASALQAPCRKQNKAGSEGRICPDVPGASAKNGVLGRSAK
jgi:hypothetical protein